MYFRTSISSCHWLLAKFLIMPQISSAMDTINLRVKEHDDLIL